MRISAEDSVYPLDTVDFTLLSLTEGCLSEHGSGSEEGTHSFSSLFEERQIKIRLNSPTRGKQEFHAIIWFLKVLLIELPQMPDGHSWPCPL